MLYVTAVRIVRLREGPVSSEFRRSGRTCLAIVGSAGILGTPISEVLVRDDGPVVVMPQDFAKDQVLRQPGPNAVAARMVPITVLIRSL